MVEIQVEILITKDTVIGEIVERYPEVVDTLANLGVHCVGCHVSAYESIEMGFKSHGMTDEQINEAVNQLNAVVENVRKVKGEGVKLTENAVNKLNSLLSSENKQALRIDVEKGGCSGFSYVFSLEDEKKEDDLVIFQDGVKVFVGSEALQKMKGAVVDYKDSLQGAGFKVSNPVAEATCGCGKSFR